MTLAFPWLRIGATLCLAAPLSAQNFNIDVGTGTPLPAITFGAAAAQPGTWNPVNRTVGATPVSLFEVGGAATGVTIARTSGGGSAFFSDNVATTGDDGALMDDIEFPTSSTGSVWTISGLSAGTYEVYTYAWAPDSAAFFTNVSVNGGANTSVGGTWTGSYTVGLTHALDTVTIASGGTIAIALSVGTSVASFNGLQIKSLGTPTTSYCLGDGTGTLCPCSNVGVNGHGCANSVNPSGALLTATGVASATIANDSFQLNAAGVPNGPGLYFQGTTQLNGGLGVLFGDGLRCTGGTIIRLGIVQAAGNASTYPTGVTPPNNIRISQKGLITAGDVRNYQLWYRDSGVFCTASVFNLTNAINVTWQP